jgi:hypothetical protein
MNIIKNMPVEGSEQRLMGTDIFYNDTERKLPVVIYIHGFNGLKDWANFDLIAMQFAEAGYFFIKMNMSHNGTTLETPLDFTDLEAFGMNNYTKELFDVGQIINWICDESNPHSCFADTENIALLGHSRGGGIAILKAYKDIRVKALITWASIAECKTPWGTMSKEKMEKWQAEGVMYYANKRTQQQLPLYYQLYEDYMEHAEHLDIRKAISGLKIPILLCHGKEDPAVPYTKALDLKRWQPTAILFTVESDHVFGRSHPWIASFLPLPMQTVVDESLRFLKGLFSIGNQQ